MDFELNITWEEGGYKVELINEFGRLIAWSWRTDIYAAILETAIWGMRQSPGDMRDILRALLNLNIEKIKASVNPDGK